MNDEYAVIYESILDYVKDLKIIDTHEHLPAWESQRNLKNDFLTDFLSHYLSSDLKSSGLTEKGFKKVNDKSIPVKDRWKLVGPFWEYCKYTGYGRAVSISVRDLYGYDSITADTIEAINQKYLSNLRKGYFKEILKDKCGIRISINDGFSNEIPDPEFFALALHINRLVMPSDPNTFETYENETGINVRSLSDWLTLVKRYIESRIIKGCRVLKCSLAYERTIAFASVDLKTAEEEFNSELLRFRQKKGDALFNDKETRNFQDYMLHYILGIASENRMTVQFHTGIQEGNGNDLRNSNPLSLTNLFMKYPKVDFDLFHIGYPFYMEAGVLAKNFPNVYLDMCWAHIISPNASVNALLEWLDTVPYNKISAFGGDYLFVEGVYGHLVIARGNISRALALKVAEGIFSVKVAKKIAKMLFYDNPNRIFKLGL
ncbi:MAG: amidohydrolase family protein [Clostridia bacterium]|nr:amidohydrolase family protein [Clostridia bacterium]